MVDPSLVALRAWSRAVRAYQLAVSEGQTQDLEPARRQVQHAKSRYLMLGRQSESDRSAGFDKVAARSRHLRVVTSPEGAARMWSTAARSSITERSG